MPPVSLLPKGVWTPLRSGLPERLATRERLAMRWVPPEVCVGQDLTVRDVLQQLEVALKEWSAPWLLLKGRSAPWRPAFAQQLRKRLFCSARFAISRSPLQFPGVSFSHALSSATHATPFGHVTDSRSWRRKARGSGSEQMSMFRPLSSTVARSFARAAHVHARASSAAASKPASAVASVLGRKDQDRAGDGARRWATSPLGSRSMSTPLAGGSAEAAPAGGQPAAPAGGQPAGLSPPAQAVIVDEQNFNAVVQTLAPQ